MKNNIRLLYIHRFFGMGLFFVPVGILFLLQNGLANLQVFFIAGFFGLINIIMEVPSGIFADKYGRKIAIILSNANFFIGTFIYAIGNEFFIFLVGEFFFAIGVSLMSGTDSAFVYDTLKQLRKQENFKKAYGNYQFITFAALGIYSLAGGFIGYIDLRLSFWISLIPIGIAVIISCFLKEPRVSRSVEVNHWSHLKEAFCYVRSHSGIKF